MEAIDLKFTATQLVKIIDNCWDSIVIVDKSSKVIYANNSFLMLIGYGKDKVIGSPFELFLYSKFQDEFEKLVARIESTDVQSFIKVVCKTKDEHDIMLHIGMFKIIDSDYVVLNVKHIHDPSISSNATTPKVNPEKISEKETKKESDFLDKTFGWLNGANKAIESMFNSQQQKAKPKQQQPTKKYSPAPSLVLPNEIEVMSRDDLRDYVRADIDTFHSIGYVNYTKEQLIAAKEWHSWQVSVMLQLYKSGDKLFIPEKETIFPEAITELTKHTLEKVVQSMITNYKTRANINAKKEILSKDAKWSAMEVGCLLYFILE